MASTTPASTRAIALLGSHLPRHCGIATFTSDLADAISSRNPAIDAIVVAMNDSGLTHAYPPRVRFAIAEADVDAYRHAADFLNRSRVDVLCLQHEYGIFGGQAGGHVLELVRGLHVPVVTTLHTVLPNPDPAQDAVLRALLALSDRVVVMSSDSARLLHELHAIDVARIDVIPHGIPAATEADGKEALGLTGRIVILTFGLLSPDKGIEYVIDAMPAIVARHQNAVYIVLGETHPHVRQSHGERYRRMLEQRAVALGIERNVIFRDRFVSHAELVTYLAAADLYVTPYLNEEQSTSGTLAYAVGSGKAVISTPYRYARELLAGGCGALVPWRDAAAISERIIGLIDAPAQLSALQDRARAVGRSMGWPIVAGRYLAAFEQARLARAEQRSSGVMATNRWARRPALPAIDLGHIERMTDDTGLLQHATFAVPRYRDGYSVDDNARALLLMVHIERAGEVPTRRAAVLASRYLAFIAFAFEERSGRFRNFLSYARVWDADAPSEDSHGRCLWALGTLVGRSTNRDHVGLAAQLFRDGLQAADKLGSPRAWAYTLLGINEYLARWPDGTDVRAMRDRLVHRLLGRLQQSRAQDWPWFEDRLTYCNARLPQALLVSAAHMGEPGLVTVAEQVLDWLARQHTGADGSFAPVGTDGFHVRGARRADYDQQPVEACAMVSACLDAHRLSGQAHWLDHARRAFEWFRGQNALHAEIADPQTGGCRDGLHSDRVNQNQGAESTLSFLLALVDMRAAEHSQAVRVTGSGVWPERGLIATRTRLEGRPRP